MKFYSINFFSDVYTEILQKADIFFIACSVIVKKNLYQISEFFISFEENKPLKNFAYFSQHCKILELN